jgi:hypothetical protein
VIAVSVARAGIVDRGRARGSGDPAGAAGCGRAGSVAAATGAAVESAEVDA